MDQGNKRLQRVCFFKHATNGKSDKAFLLTLKSFSKRLSAPAPGLFACIELLSSFYKIRLQKDFIETCI